MTLAKGKANRKKAFHWFGNQVSWAEFLAQTFSMTLNNSLVLCVPNFATYKLEYYSPSQGCCEDKTYY